MKIFGQEPDFDPHKEAILASEGKSDAHFGAEERPTEPRHRLDEVTTIAIRGLVPPHKVPKTGRHA